MGKRPIYVNRLDAFRGWPDPPRSLWFRRILPSVALFKTWVKHGLVKAGKRGEPPWDFQPRYFLIVEKLQTRAERKRHERSRPRG